LVVDDDVDHQVADHEQVDGLVAHLGQPAARAAASATAIRAASAALARMISMLARRLSPPVASWKYESRNGVMALPRTPSDSAAARPSASTRSCRARSTCRSSDSGFTTSS